MNKVKLLLPICA